MFTKKLKTLTLYQFSAIGLISLIMGGVLILNLVLGVILRQNGESGGSVEFPVIISALIWGYVFFVEVFNFAIINGVSRKSYFFSTCIFAFGLAGATALIATIFSTIAREIAYLVEVFNVIYPNGNVLAMFTWFWGALFLMIILGLFAGILMHSLSKKAKFVLIGVLAVIAPVVILLNHYIGGIINGLARFGLMFLGVFGDTMNSYYSVLMLLGLSALLVGVSWLFMRKIELK